jgi:hypothetical protein
MMAGIRNPSQFRTHAPQQILQYDGSRSTSSEAGEKQPGKPTPKVLKED